MRPTVLNKPTDLADLISAEMAARGLSYRQAVNGTDYSHNLLWSITSGMLPRLDNALTAADLMGWEMVIRKRKKT